MEAKELRIGNLVTADSDRFQVYKIEPHHFTNDDFLDLIFPIPLTEEWLLKFGFEYNDYYETYSYLDYCIHIKDKEFNFMNDSYSNAGCYYLTTVKHVHQLQNLYFALTGEELEIKE